MRDQDPTTPTRLIVGLGNPGPEYADSRHNIGFRVIARLAHAAGIRLDRKMANARTGIGERDGLRLVLARPQTYMNLSGQAVVRLVTRFGVTPENIIVIHDDLDLPLGRIRLRRGGGAGGHKGISSVIAELGSPDFVRVRIGIGKPTGADEADVVDYVLGDFTPDEEIVIAPAVRRASAAVACWLREGLERAMNTYNAEPRQTSSTQN